MAGLWMFQTDYPHTGLLSPTSKSSSSQLHQKADLPPAVVLRHPANDDYHEESPSSSSDQRAQKLNTQGDGKTSVATYYTLIYQQNCTLFCFIKNNTLKQSYRLKVLKILLHVSVSS
jgi:hypothetical protein